jgi:hypothetical protein
MLSKKVFTNVIKTYSDSVFFLTAEDNQRLLTVGASDWFSIDGQRIKGSNISEILTIQEYYKQNPEAKPVSYPDFTGTKPTQYSKKKTIRNINSMISGFKKVFEGRDVPEPSKIILEKMKTSLREVEESEDKPSPMFVNKMFGYN